MLRIIYCLHKVPKEWTLCSGHVRTRRELARAPSLKSGPARPRCNTHICLLSPSCQLSKDTTINHLNLIQYFAPVGPRRCLFFVTSDSFRSGVPRMVTNELLRRPSQGNRTMRVASPTVLRLSFSARNVYRRPPSQAGLPTVCRSRACIRTSLPAAVGFTVVSCRRLLEVQPSPGERCFGT